MKKVELKQKINQKLDTLTTEELSLVDTLLTNLNSYFQNQKTPNHFIPKSEEERRKLIRELRGKYAHFSNSSEDFAQRKQEEIDWEERNR
jgi:hypothetical protein